jgi:hypothetical protein
MWSVIPPNLPLKLYVSSTSPLSYFSEFSLRSVSGCLAIISSMLLNGPPNEGLLLLLAIPTLQFAQLLSIFHK